MPPRHATTLPALRSLVDFSSLHALRARRAAREPRPAEKLALLRRLAQKTVFGNLPETRVEQSWNEQLFAKVLGYRTLLSHDARPFHILPKNAADRYHYDDFSLGFFGAGEDIVLGSAELKSPGARAWTRRRPAAITTTGRPSSKRWRPRTFTAPDADGCWSRIFASCACTTCASPANRSPS